MGRPHIEFIQSLEVPERDLADGPFAGARARMLSEDDADGSYSALVRLPAGLSAELAALSRPVELFVLEGRLELDGNELLPGFYAFVPSGAGSLSAPEETLALVLVDPERQPRGAAVEVVATDGMRWMNPRVEGDIPPGIVVKPLHTDEETQDWTWIAASAPGWQEDRAEIHDTIEEALMLRGDILLGERGSMTPGCYFWRPPFVRHGPMLTRDGALFFFRSKGGMLTVEYEDVPGWEQMVGEYRAAQPYFAATA